MLRFFRQYYPIRNIFFVMGEGVFIYVSVLTAAFITTGPSALHEHPWFYAKLFLITIVCQACLYYNELYDLNIIDSLKELAVRLMQSFGVAGIFLSFVYLAFPETIIGSVIFMAGVGIVIVLLACWRFGYSILLSRGLFNQQIILLGSGDLTRKIRTEINARKDCGYTVAMEVPESVEDADPERPADVPLICRFKFEGLCELSRELKTEKIVVSFREKRCILPTQELLRCRVDGIDVIEGNSFYEMLTGKLLVEFINPSWLIFSNGFQKSRMRRIVKRTVDLILSSALLVALSPFFLLVAIAIRLDSPGPIFFSQMRVGERQPHLPHAQVPLHGQGRREAERPGVGPGKRPARHPGGQVSAEVSHRRASPALERAQGRDELRGPAARARVSSCRSWKKPSPTTASGSRSNPGSPAGPRSTTATAPRSAIRSRS